MKQYFEEREFVRVASSQEAAKATIEPQRRGESNEEWKKRADEWDEGADVMGKITSFFSGKKEEKEQPKAAKAEKPASEATEEKKDKPFFGLF
mmetsp:Transcript_19518/g.73877  ORF Transcript_19518/g.73877 Transcript_19518/m.73877 type:complete len:93 (+) Transcript_19518:399-677(+)